MFNLPKFPYFNMQQLNLDWLMDKVGRTLEVIALPALATNDSTGFKNAIDYAQLAIPKGVSILLFGSESDTNDHRGMALCLKFDTDNMTCALYSLSFAYGASAIKKLSGVWYG